MCLETHPSASLIVRTSFRPPVVEMKALRRQKTKQHSQCGSGVQICILESGAGWGRRPWQRSIASSAVVTHTQLRLKTSAALPHKSKAGTQGKGLWGSFSRLSQPSSHATTEQGPESWPPSPTKPASSTQTPRPPLKKKKERKNPSLRTIPSRKPFSVHWKTGNASKGLKAFQWLCPS